MTREEDAGKAILRLALPLDAAANMTTSFMEARSIALSMLLYRCGKPKDIVMMSTSRTSAA